MGNNDKPNGSARAFLNNLKGFNDTQRAQDAITNFIDNRKNSESLTNDLVDMVRDHSLDMSLNSDKKVVTH